MKNMRIQKDLQARWRRALQKNLGRGGAMDGQLLLETLCAQAARDGLSAEGKIRDANNYAASMAATRALLRSLERVG